MNYAPDLSSEGMWLTVEVSQHKTAGLPAVGYVTKRDRRGLQPRLPDTKIRIFAMERGTVVVARIGRESAAILPKSALAGEDAATRLLEVLKRAGVAQVL
jgi:hypothetical protein